MYSDSTSKKARVDPDSTQPYCISDWRARSSALSIGLFMRSAVKNAAKLAVYEEIMMRVKNHHKAATVRVDVALVEKCCYTTIPVESGMIEN